MSEETVMTIDYAERHSVHMLDSRLAAGYDDVVFEMRDDLLAAIDELRSTIGAQHDTVSESNRMLEQAHDDLREMETALAMGRETIAAKDARIAELEAGDAQWAYARIAWLEAQLSNAQTVAEERLSALRQRNTIIAVHQTKEQAQSDLIIELRTQLSAALATIERMVEDHATG